MFKNSFLLLRSLIFYFVFIVTVVLHTSLCVILGIFFPAKKRFPYFVLWNKFIIWWLRISCNIQVNITGLENIPNKPFIIISNHQSTWETIFIYGYFQPLTAILKKELLFIPFFGWALAMLKPIAIDRSKKRSARKMLISQGQDRLNNGISVLIFPEGTRLNPGQEKPWSTGGATMAIEAKATILPLAHNAGHFWPAHKIIKYPGTIDVIIGKPIDATSQSSRELTEQVSTWIKQAVSTESS